MPRSFAWRVRTFVNITQLVVGGKLQGRQCLDDDEEDNGRRYRGRRTIHEHTGLSQPRPSKAVVRGGCRAKCRGVLSGNGSWGGARIQETVLRLTRGFLSKPLFSRHDPGKFDPRAGFGLLYSPDNRHRRIELTWLLLVFVCHPQPKPAGDDGTRERAEATLTVG